MRLRFWVSLCACLALVGCYSTPGGGEARVRLNAFNGEGRPVYAYPPDPGAPSEIHCFTVRGFPQVPAHIGISTTNPAGIGRVQISVVRGGKVIETSIVAAPDWTATSLTSGSVTRTDITFTPPGGGRVVSDALAVFDVTAPAGATGVSVYVYDTTDYLVTALVGVRIWPAGDPAACS